VVEGERLHEELVGCLAWGLRIAGAGEHDDITGPQQRLSGSLRQGWELVARDLHGSLTDEDSEFRAGLNALLGRWCPMGGVTSG
jgi:hypothetical protein